MLLWRGGQNRKFPTLMLPISGGKKQNAHKSTKIYSQFFEIEQKKLSVIFFYMVLILTLCNQTLEINS